MSLSLLTVMWGDYHIGLFEQACFRSLMWPKNKEALKRQQAHWTIFTDSKKYSERLEKLFEGSGVSLVVRDESELRDRIDPIQAALIWQIEKCLYHENRLLLAPPDTVFGDGSVQALLEIGADKGSCVVVPHPRVHPALLTELDEGTSNADLVYLAWQHLHRSWKDAESGCERQNSYIGGVSWRRLDADTMAITHRLPTVYLADFTAEDLEYFKTRISFGAYDHEWPGDILLPRERQRFVGSSDGAFIVEITEELKNVPPFNPSHPREGFWKNHAHNRINRGIVSIFRASSPKAQSLRLEAP